MKKQAVIVADDHPVFRLGLSQIINNSNDFSVVAEAENTSELFQAVKETPCDIVVLDMKMIGNRDGLTALKKLKQTHPNKKVMIISQMCSADLVREAMDLGADGYVTKNDIADMILPFLMSIGKGERALSPRIQSMLLSAKGDAVDDLTDRESEILHLSVEGLSREEIASRLDISISTVNFHRQNIKEKLQAGSLADMIRIAHEKGLVE